MGSVQKCAFVFVLALSVIGVLLIIYAYPPLSLEDVAKLRWLDDIKVALNKSLVPAKLEAGVSPVDPIAAANINEDLDYRIAQRMKSAEGWRSFLAAHPDGPHAQSARAELDKLVPTETPPAMAAAHAPNGGPPESKTPSNAASPGRSSAGSEFATPTDERAPAPADSSPLLGQACASERSELDRLRQEPSAEAAGLFWRNMRCEGLRPQVRLLLESLNAAADPVGSAAAPSEPEARGATSDVPTAIGVGPAGGRRRNPTSATPSASPAR
jgi:hypothetical protein